MNVKEYAKAISGGILAGLMRRIDKTARVISIEDVAGLEKAQAELAG